jgi:hypothetical protein
MAMFFDIESMKKDEALATNPLKRFEWRMRVEFKDIVDLLWMMRKQLMQDSTSSLMKSKRRVQMNTKSSAKCFQIHQ